MLNNKSKADSPSAGPYFAALRSRVGEVWSGLISGWIKNKMVISGGPKHWEAPENDEGRSRSFQVGSKLDFRRYFYKIYFYCVSMKAWLNEISFEVTVDLFD